MTKTKEIVNVNALYFHVAAMVASTEETRYYLNGVFIKAHPKVGAILVATDGHRIIVIHDEHGTAPKEGVIISYGDKYSLSKACKVTRKQSIDGGVGDVKLSVCEKGFATVRGAGDFTYHIHPKKSIIDGTFPDYKRVIPWKKMKTFDNSHFNQGYIQTFCKISSIEPNSRGYFSTMKNSTVCISPNNDEGRSPTIFRLGMWDNAIFILMPMAAMKPNTPCVPEWLHEVNEA